jgi:hypothetical protein
MIEKARVLKTQPNVLTYLRHRITNATAEGLNSTIQCIRYTARGFRNRENFKTAIYFHCGKLDLYPHRSRKNRLSGDARERRARRRRRRKERREHSRPVVQYGAPEECAVALRSGRQHHAQAALRRLV